MFKVEFRRMQPCYRLPVALIFTVLKFSFSVGLDYHRLSHLLELNLYTNRSRLLAWESYVTINLGKPYQTTTGRTLHRFTVVGYSSDHYVLLARWISKRCPWLAQYEPGKPSYTPEGDPIPFSDLPQGRIRPFGWLWLRP